MLLDASHSLLKHAEAIAEHDGASLSRQELGLLARGLEARALELAGLPYRAPYNLRHTFA